MMIAPRIKVDRINNSNFPSQKFGPMQSCTYSPTSSISRKAFRQRHGFEHGFGFVDGFLIFAFGRGIVDPAAAGLNVSLAVFDQRGADGDATVKVAVEGEVTDA